MFSKILNKLLMIFLTGLVTTILTFAIFYKDIFSGFALMFISEDAPHTADAALMLGGNMTGRINAVIDLYKRGRVKKILVSEERTPENTVKFFENYPGIYTPPVKAAEKILTQENVDFEIIKSSKGGATSTFDEAYDFSRWVRSKNVKSLILVTDSFHTRRAAYAFKKVMAIQGVKIEIYTLGVMNKTFLPDRWWKSERGLKSYIVEFFSFPIYIMRSANLEAIEE